MPQNPARPVLAAPAGARPVPTAGSGHRAIAQEMRDRPQYLPDLRAGPAGSSFPACASPSPRAKDAHGYRRAGHLHHEPSEPAEHSEPAAHGENTGRASHEAHAETLLGINPEATPLVVIAILLSLVLAAAVIAVRSPCCCPASP